MVKHKNFFFILSDKQYIINNIENTQNNYLLTKLLCHSKRPKINKRGLGILKNNIEC